MYDIFLTEDVHKLVKRKTIVFLGDSNVRALYKDFLCLLQNSHYIPQSVLRNKMENTVYGDNLIYHGRKTNGRCYREEREALFDNTCVSFFFLTKVYDDYVEDVLKRITRRSKPDVIIINSCVWDITRWGCDGVYNYKKNLKFLMKEFRRLIPRSLIIWITTPPLAAEMKGGFLVKELQFLKYSLRFHVVEANHFARKVVVDNGFDILDTHFHLQMQIHRRSHDGIHWDPKAVRYITNLILRHISLSWDVPLPHRYKSTIVDENLMATEDAKNLGIIKLETKKNAVDMKEIHSKKSADPKSSEKIQNAVAVVIKQEDSKKKRRASIQLYRVPKREESIHNHMARADKKARCKRIHKWKQSVLGDSSQSSLSLDRNSCVRNSKQDQRSAYEANLSNSFQSNQQNFNLVTPSTPMHNSLKKPFRKSLHHNISLITSPSQIPLPPYSPGYQQDSNNYMQSDESEPLLFNRSNDFDFTLITSPSQIPLPPYSPGNHHHHHGDYMQRDESQPLLYSNRSVHFDFPVITCPSQIPLPFFQLENVPSQRHVFGYEASSRSMPDFVNDGNGESSCSQHAFLNRQSVQHNRIYETANNSVVPHKFPHATPEQILQPKFDFVNDEIPEVYYF
ncbi:uncharacterized protein LOC129984328 [Argiope bruennichi]|uniref:PC-esterase domain-containing protein 1A n=1 Tax=Argiope bruennichi TaxID=94029 RepID=A0A8T0EMQ2_ARGBR|nr:uncharacterized protein LOC129984328 [Argiope bruennichi]KAF8774811.1 PC-esterase domain-containing protein 1A [Argiope bruennichi]